MHAKKKTGSAGEWVDPDDAPPLTKEMLDDADWFEGNRFIKHGRGRPPTGNAKEQISVRLDQEVLAKLREAGPGWQSQINPLLRQALDLGRHAAAALHQEVAVAAPATSGKRTREKA
jgi:uncharacterized protein (DUF4415 family)